MSLSQFHSIELFILRHAWLNLWDKHMTTGRINQVCKRKTEKKRKRAQQQAGSRPLPPPPSFPIKKEKKIRSLFFSVAFQTPPERGFLQQKEKGGRFFFLVQKWTRLSSQKNWKKAANQIPNKERKTSLAQNSPWGAIKIIAQQETNTHFFFSHEAEKKKLRCGASCTLGPSSVIFLFSPKIRGKKNPTHKVKSSLPRQRVPPCRLAINKP